MSYILHIDTSGNNGLVALSKDGFWVSKKVNENERDHATTINLHIDELLKEAKITLANISAVAVIAGPGSYTGLRIGLATAKGICYAGAIPLMLYNKLDLMVQYALREDRDYDFYLALLPARVDEFFITLFDKDGNNIISARHVHINELNLIKETYQNLIIIKDEKEVLEGDSWYQIAAKDLIDQRFSPLSSSIPFYLKDVYTTQSKKI